MKLVAIALSAVLMFATAGFSQSQSNSQSNTPGAKRLFDDTSSGVRLGNSDTRPAAPRPGASNSAPRPAAPGTQPAPGGQPTSSAKPATPDVTGLMYYVEVIQPSGQALRVNTTRVFHSGERIRFHVLSNVSGRLTILQSENNAAFLPLFPTAQLHSGDNRVEQGKETVIPMAFDNKPSEIRLLLMLVADSTAAPSATAAPQTASSPRPASAPGSNPAPVPSSTAAPTPGPAPTPAPTQSSRTAPQSQPVAQASADNRPPLAPITADKITVVLNQQAKSKGLKVEVDEAPTQAATYVVSDVRQDANAVPGTVAVEVRISHQP